MNTHLFRSICIAVLILFLFALFAPAANACRRCGFSGSSCHFVHHAPVIHHDPPATVTNFIFNSQFPGNYFPQQGASVYGYNAGGYGPTGFSLLAQAQYVDPAMVIDRAARLGELSQQNATAGIQGFNDISTRALALNDQLNQRQNNAAIATVAINALQNNNQPSPQAQSLKVSISSTGQTTAEWLPPSDKPVEFKLQGTDISLTCAKCHNLAAADAPKGFVFDGKGMTRAEFDWASEAVWAGKMPPNSKLDRAGKSQVVEKMRSMIQ